MSARVQRDPRPPSPVHIEEVEGIRIPNPQTTLETLLQNMQEAIKTFKKKMPKNAELLTKIESFAAKNSHSISTSFSCDQNFKKICADLKDYEEFKQDSEATFLKFGAAPHQQIIDPCRRLIAELDEHIQPFKISVLEALKNHRMATIEATDAIARNLCDFWEDSPKQHCAAIYTSASMLHSLLTTSEELFEAVAATVSKEQREFHDDELRKQENSLTITSSEDLILCLEKLRSDAEALAAAEDISVDPQQKTASEASDLLQKLQRETEASLNENHEAKLFSLANKIKNLTIDPETPLTSETAENNLKAIQEIKTDFKKLKTFFPTLQLNILNHLHLCLSLPEIPQSNTLADLRELQSAIAQFSTQLNKMMKPVEKAIPKQQETFYALAKNFAMEQSPKLEKAWNEKTNEEQKESCLSTLKRVKALSNQTKAANDYYSKLELKTESIDESLKDLENITKKLAAFEKELIEFAHTHNLPIPGEETAYYLQAPWSALANSTSKLADAVQLGLGLGAAAALYSDNANPEPVLVGAALGLMGGVIVSAKPIYSSADRLASYVYGAAVGLAGYAFSQRAIPLMPEFLLELGRDQSLVVNGALVATAALKSTPPLIQKTVTWVRTNNPLNSFRLPRWVPPAALSTAGTLLLTATRTGRKGLRTSFDLAITYPQLAAVAAVATAYAGYKTYYAGYKTYRAFSAPAKPNGLEASEYTARDFLKKPKKAEPEDKKNKTEEQPPGLFGRIQKSAEHLAATVRTSGLARFVIGVAVLGMTKETTDDFAEDLYLKGLGKAFVTSVAILTAHWQWTAGTEKARKITQATVSRWQKQTERGKAAAGRIFSKARTMFQRAGKKVVEQRKPEPVVVEDASDDEKEEDLIAAVHKAANKLGPEEDELL